LPDRVADLSAVRVGNRVSLTWTMPRRNTDKILLKGDIDVGICRKQGAESDAGKTLCEPAGQLQLPPASDGTFTENLPGELTTGPPRILTYSVELKNRSGRSAGLSNPAPVVAGEAPPPVTGLAAEVLRAGVVLRWNAGDPGVSIRLVRKLLTPPAPKPRTGLLPSTAEPIEQKLLVEANAGEMPAQALDKSIAFGNTYEYRAQRVIRETMDNRSVELEGELSAPIRVEALDVFPPAVPTGLAAVATAPDSATGTPASIDLSWQPNTEADLAGYEVYRREDETPWERISGNQPVVGPAFHDARVVPGHTYHYGVSAIDKSGHESPRSPAASETVPNE
jgi:hypothetical protein